MILQTFLSQSTGRTSTVLNRKKPVKTISGAVIRENMGRAIFVTAICG
ncbi:MAG: hypothetical protein OFPII_11710 [Osedax symbiont Rs1]|nr:MAG: hypothetical protein OFPII_11710 [Osedax symbiont Rs1]